MELKFTIRSVAQKTGLSVHTIRAWEKRYQAITPVRTDTNRRLYNQNDIDKLNLLRQSLEGGHSIGRVAHLSISEISFIGNHPLVFGPVNPRADTGAASLDLLSACEVAMYQLDQEVLHETLVRAGSRLGFGELVESVIAPLIAIVDSRWTDGTGSISQEHMVSAVLKGYLSGVRSNIQVQKSAPRLLVATPKNQLHEIGALIASAYASVQGWNVTYLGPNVPADEIANSAKNCSAHAIALSLVYPLDDPDIPIELNQLRKLVGDEMPILVGGRGTIKYREALIEINAKATPSGLKDFLIDI
jgi:methylmalonyl-CoA mutase cobalamin-binding subunit